MEERQNLVVKSNALIQQTRMRLTAPEQKMIAYICSNLQLEQGKRDYQINLLDYFKVCGIERNGNNYQDIKQLLQDLYNKSTWITIGNKEILFSWLSGVIIDRGSGIVDIEVNKFVLPYLVDLKKSFTKYELGYILAMKSKYSIRIYELMKSYEFKKQVEFTIDDLQSRLMSDYDRYPDFKRKVIAIAVEEINRLTDIIISFEEIKLGRKVDSLLFTIIKKTAAQRMSAHAWIADALDK